MGIMYAGAIGKICLWMMMIMATRPFPTDIKVTSSICLKFHRYLQYRSAVIFILLLGRYRYNYRYRQRLKGRVQYSHYTYIYLLPNCNVIVIVFQF